MVERERMSCLNRPFFAETILSTKDMPLVVTGELVQFIAKMPGRRFYSNGREVKAEKESFLVSTNEPDDCVCTYFNFALYTLQIRESSLENYE